MPFEIVRNDIVKMKVDAVVNASNTALQMGGGVCGDIFAVAGADRLRAECDKTGFCEVGKAVITPGYDLPAKYIIHTVGPVWQGGGYNEEKLLESCYTKSLDLALENGCGSVAFPLISSGIHGYPKDKALKTAVSAIGAYVLKHEILVYLVVYDRDSYMLSDKLFSDIMQYIDDNYVSQHALKPRIKRQGYPGTQRPEANIEVNMCNAPIMPVKDTRCLENIMKHLEESFSQMLLRLIDEKGETDVNVYKKANIDRKLFSKIRSYAGYRPSKVTAVAFAIALELDIDNTKDLLCKAGFALSRSSKFDLIIEYYISNCSYNIFDINKTLFAFNQSLLGA